MLISTKSPPIIDQVSNRYDQKKKSLTPAEQQREQIKQRIRRIHEERRIRSIKFAKTIRVTLYFLLGIGSVILILLAVLVIMMLGSSQSKKFNTWHFEPAPVTYGFEEFGVSSNSEFCNEMARTLYNEEYNINQIAVSMVFCLEETEQFQGRNGGNGAAITTNLEGNGCEESETSPDGEFDSTKFLIGKLSAEERFEVFQRVLNFELYPMSHSAAEFTRRTNTERLFGNVEDGFESSEPSDKLQTEGTVLKMNYLQSAWKFNQTEETEMPFGNERESIMLDLNRTVCGATDGMRASTSFPEYIADAISLVEIEKGLKSIIKMDDFTKNPILYFLAHGVIKNMSKLLMDRTKNDHLTSHRRLGIRKKWEPSYSANFFALFDRKAGEAVAFSQTNNDTENSWRSSTWGYRPIIVVNNSTRCLIYAGSGGNMYESMEISRMAHTVLAYLYSDAPITTILTTPMFFPVRDGHYYTDGFVLGVLSRVMRLAHVSGSETFYLEKRKLQGQDTGTYKDTGSVIDVRENEIFPVFFDHNGPQIMPNGV
nr:unnamed protein product [Haemonchus contortus]